eukprot:GHRR01027755.1.p1 GENE.GHRR01027755.1~~GHRR01027755.1.p1  ORF type:complete len:127 (-),score=20.67 GHRR01027755.1:41-421(-)
MPLSSRYRHNAWPSAAAKPPLLLLLLSSPMGPSDPIWSSLLAERCQCFIQLCRVKVSCNYTSTQWALQQHKPQLARLYLLVHRHELLEGVNAHAVWYCDWQVGTFQKCAGALQDAWLNPTLQAGNQ